jgi:UDPglucose--hexose-1-phosphate uridylyltransferase
MNEAPRFEVDPITGTQVIYAPQRAERSNAFAIDVLDVPAGPCPFCPGNEAETPPEVWAIRPAASRPNTPGWTARVVRNRYPTLAPPGAIASFDTGLHEVLIETDRHEATWADMTAQELATTFEAIQHRLRTYAVDERLQSVQVFKNFGIRAGASLAHPHLQLLALCSTPAFLVRELQRSQAWTPQHGEDYWQQAIDQARAEERAVLDEGGFVTVCPAVSRVPYEMWLLPTRPELHWQDAKRADFQALAQHVSRVMHQLQGALGFVAHNVIWRLPPLRESATPWYRWRLELVPRLITFAGFELGAGIYVNPILPTQAAARLRGG